MNDENLQKVVDEYIKKTPVEKLFDLNAFGKRVVFISPEDKTTEKSFGSNRCFCS